MRHLHRLALLPLAVLWTMATPAQAQQARPGAALPSPCAAHLQAAQARADLDAVYNPCRLDDGAVASEQRRNDGASARQDWENMEAEPPRHRFADLGEQSALGLALGAVGAAGDLGWRSGALPGWLGGTAGSQEAGAARWQAPQDVAWREDAPPGWLRQGGSAALGSVGLRGGPVTAREGGGSFSAPVPEPAGWLSLLAGLILLSAGKARRAVRR